MQYMLDAILPLQNNYSDLKPTKLKPAWALSRNNAWWDAEYAWLDVDTELTHSQWKQYAGSQVTWWTRHMLTCYTQGGIWDWHSDQHIFDIGRNHSDNHAVRTVIAVLQGQINLYRKHNVLALNTKTMLAFKSSDRYKLTAVPNTICLSVWGMRSYKQHPKPKPVAKYKKKHNREI